MRTFLQNYCIKGGLADLWSHRPNSLMSLGANTSILVQLGPLESEPFRPNIFVCWPQCYKEGLPKGFEGILMSALVNKERSPLIGPETRVS